MNIKDFYHIHKSKLPLVASLVVSGVSIVTSIVLHGQFTGQIKRLELSAMVSDLYLSFLQDQVNDLEQDMILLRR